jgi:hypothetical protein
LDFFVVYRSQREENAKGKEETSLAALFEEKGLMPVSGTIDYKVFLHLLQHVDVAAN